MNEEGGTRYFLAGAAFLSAAGAAGVAAAGVAPSAAAPSSAALAFFFFFSDSLKTRTLGRPITESPSFQRSASLSLAIRSPRVSTFRERIDPSFTFKLLSIVITACSWKSKGDPAQRAPNRPIYAVVTQHS